jgi:hypothetical protein
MATTTQLGGHGTFFADEDKTLSLEVLDADGDPVDLTGWTITFEIKPSIGASTSIASETASITGTYNATRASNTQRAEVTTSLDRAGRWTYAFRRTDSDARMVLAHGPVIVEAAP